MSTYEGMVRGVSDAFFQHSTLSLMSFHLWRFAFFPVCCLACTY